ncbi:hypothetical protein C8R45DRAFT_1208302 [Mycena sanguinolenta]|nr:hypothetical protein C8R45DRAFT_1208302 [Mycena sanguinolenta]
MSPEVIATPELLERILAQLPIRDLLVLAPLVSKTWHAVTLSPTLQRVLFLEPDPLALASERTQNPLLMEAFSPFFPSREGSTSYPGWSSLKDIETMLWSRAPDAFKREEASWRRMLVSQPPAQTMIIEQKISSMTGISERRAVLEDLSLRMGVLYDLTVPLIQDFVVCFRIHWRKLEGPADLRFEVFGAYSCTDDRRKPTKRFRSDGEKPMEIAFGQWDRRLSGLDVVSAVGFEVSASLDAALRATPTSLGSLELNSSAALNINKIAPLVTTLAKTAHRTLNTVEITETSSFWT